MAAAVTGAEWALEAQETTLSFFDSHRWLRHALVSIASIAAPLHQMLVQSKQRFHCKALLKQTVCSAVSSSCVVNQQAARHRRVLSHKLGTSHVCVLRGEVIATAILLVVPANF